MHAPPGFLPHSLLETEGREERVLAGWKVSYVHPDGPQRGLIAAINTFLFCWIAGAARPELPHYNFCFLHLTGVELISFVALLL